MTDTTTPRRGASQAAWAAYADARGVPYPDGAGRDEIRDLVESADTSTDAGTQAAAAAPADEVSPPEPEPVATVAPDTQDAPIIVDTVEVSLHRLADALEDVLAVLDAGGKVRAARNRGRNRA